MRHRRFLTNRRRHNPRQPVPAKLYVDLLPDVSNVLSPAQGPVPHRALPSIESGHCASPSAPWGNRHSGKPARRRPNRFPRCSGRRFPAGLGTCVPPARGGCARIRCVCAAPTGRDAPNDNPRIGVASSDSTALIPLAIRRRSRFSRRIWHTGRTAGPVLALRR